MIKLKSKKIDIKYSGIKSLSNKIVFRLCANNAWKDGRKSSLVMGRLFVDIVVPGIDLKINEAKRKKNKPPSVRNSFPGRWQSEV